MPAAARKGWSPACVEMCPTGAITVVRERKRPDVSEETRRAQRRMVLHVNPKPGIVSSPRPPASSRDAGGTTDQ